MSQMSSAIDHTYRYLFTSELAPKRTGGSLALATSGGVNQFPYFFQGQLNFPRLTALLLRALAKVVSSRFHLPPAMLKRILDSRDPVVTSGGGFIRFEGFSACCSAYARVDLSPDAYQGVVAGHGTTNVDFNPEMRAALARLRDNERVSFAIGTDEFSLLRGSEQIVERKVALPLRWLKGFVETQAYQARMQPRAALNKLQAVRFLRSLPRTTMAKTDYWIVPAEGGLRLSQRAAAGALRLAGLERLRVLDELAPFADSLTVYADSGAEATEWQLKFGPLSFYLTLSAEVWRGFSGEGQALESLAAADHEKLLPLVQGLLKWQAEIRPEEFAQNWNASAARLSGAFAALGSRGLVGYDASRSAYFHRELPFDLSQVAEMHPRLLNARKIVQSGGVRVLSQAEGGLEAEVPGSGVTHRVRMSAAGNRCTCPWYAKHQGSRGPCKHVLAVQIMSDAQSAD